MTPTFPEDTPHTPSDASAEVPLPESRPEDVRPATEATPAVAMARPVVTGARFMMDVAAPPPLNPLLQPATSASHAALDFLLVLLFAIVFPFLPGLLEWLMSEGAVALEPLETRSMIVQKWLSVGVVAFFALYFRLRNGTPLASFGIHCDKFGRQLLWGVGAFVGVVTVHLTVSMFVAIAIQITDSFEQVQRERVQFMRAVTQYTLWSSAGLLSAVAIHEELLFRGLLLTSARRFLGKWALAVALTSAVFSVLHFHQGVLAIFQVFFISVTLSVFFILSRSLLAVIIAHFLYDFLSFQLIPWLLKIQETFDRTV